MPLPLDLAAAPKVVEEHEYDLGMEGKSLSHVDDGVVVRTVPIQSEGAIYGFRRLLRLRRVAPARAKVGVASRRR